MSTTAAGVVVWRDHGSHTANLLLPCAGYRASNQHELGRIEIRDRFWPYQKEAGDSTVDPEQAQYVARVRDWFLEQACVTSAFGASDEKLAGDWYRAGVSIDIVGPGVSAGLRAKVRRTVQPPGRFTGHQPALLCGDR